MKEKLIKVASEAFAFLPLVVLSAILATFLGEKLGYSSLFFGVSAVYGHGKFSKFLAEKLSK